jgi:predicted enzyme related to lactoylglutathione lyase
MANSFEWIEIRAGSVEDTAHFYKFLFGCRITEKLTTAGFDVQRLDTGWERAHNLSRGGGARRKNCKTQGLVSWQVWYVFQGSGVQYEKETSTQ